RLCRDSAVRVVRGACKRRDRQKIMKNTSRIVLALALGSFLLHPAQAGLFNAPGPMTTARYSQTATLLANGKVLVAGGDGTKGALATAELYDPVTGTWIPTGALHTARDEHTATLLPNGKVLVAGGLGLASAELYDPVSGIWTVTGSLNLSRC